MSFKFRKKLPSLRKREIIYSPTDNIYSKRKWYLLIFLAICVMGYFFGGKIISSFFLISPGTVTSDRLVLRAPYDGYVYKINITTNQKMKTGDILLRIYSPKLKTQILSLQENFNRLLTIKNNKNLSSSTRSTINSSIQQERKKMFALLALQNQLDVRAPEDGTLTKLLVKNKEFVRQGIPLVEMTTHKQWHIQAFLKENSTLIYPGKKVKIILPNYKILSGHIVTQLNLSDLEESSHKTVTFIFPDEPVPDKYKINGLNVIVIL